MSKMMPYRHSAVLHGLGLLRLALHEGTLDSCLVLRLGLLRKEQFAAVPVELLLCKVDAQLALVLEALLLETQLAHVTNALDCVDGFDRLDPKVAIVSNRRISLLFKIKSGIKGHFLALQSTRGLGPLHLAGIMFALKMPDNFTKKNIGINLKTNFELDMTV